MGSCVGLEFGRGVITEEAGTFGETDRRQLCESLQSFTSVLRQAWRASVRVVYADDPQLTTVQRNTLCCCLVAQLYLTLLRPHGDHQAPLSMGFSRQEYRSGLLFPSPGDFPNPESNPYLLYWQADSLLLSHVGSNSYSMETIL